MSTLKNILIVIVGGAIVLFLISWAESRTAEVTPGPQLPSEIATTTPEEPEGGEQASIEDLIEVESPRIEAEIGSPLTISGEARGMWYFEATAPVRLENTEGDVLAESFITAQGEWMTEDFVPFEGTIEFTATPGTEGVLVLEKANPSGLAENAQELRIPVTFQ